MPQLKNTTFLCLDCEMTGLDPVNDRILEVAAARFNFQEILGKYERLINPECRISEESMAIHHILPQMVADQPKIHEILSEFFKFVGKDIIIGHGVGYDVSLLIDAAKRAGIPTTIQHNPIIDTLRLARLYGDSPNNSLEYLAQHFNVPSEGAHRAMNDVIMNIEIFKHLVRRYQTTEQLFKILSNPIKMKFMPLGKHKGRPFSEIPLQYLQHAATLNFDQDLLFSIRSELKRRKQGGGFQEISNPFSGL
jgi:DNA polymerase-3 subunit epsilon